MRVGGTALTGMQVATARLARSAYKVATMNTGTSALERVSAERPSAARPSAPGSGQLGDSYKVHNFQGPTQGTNTDLAFEAIEQIQAVHSFRANVAMLQADDERYGSLLDIVV